MEADSLIEKRDQFLSGLLSMLLRGLGLAARFGLVLYLTKYFGLEIVGIFGLVTAAIAMAPSFLSLGLHYRLNRAAVDFSPEEVVYRMRDRLILYIAVFASFVPIILFLIYNFAPEGIRIPNIVAVLLLILFFEACAVELGLILISIRRVVLANVFLFLRNAFWVFPFIVSSYFFSDLHGISSVLNYWLSGLLIAFFYAVFSLRDLPWRSALAQPVNFRWFFVGFNTSFMILLSDIGLVGGQFIDRAMLGFFLSIEDIGVYTFFWSLSNGVHVLVQSAVVQPAFPRLVRSVNSGFKEMIISELAIVMKSALLVAILLGIVVFVLCLVALPSLDKSVLTENAKILAVLLVGTSIRLLADVANYGLYALHLDKSLAWINVSSVFLLAAYSMLFVSYFGLIGVGYAIILTSVSLVMLRLHFINKFSAD